jgi:ERCC4-type nuclease
MQHQEGSDTVSDATPESVVSAPQHGALVDDRESAVYGELATHFPDVNVSRTRLVTGDIHIVREARTVMVLERKTRADLRASLIDGRFHTQRARMVAQFGRDRIAFVIEGGTDWSEPEAGAEVGLLLRDRVPVFWTSSPRDTAALVSRLTKADLEVREAPPDVANAVRVAPASTACPKRSLAAMLRCIPGVSARRACCIAALFGSMANLARDLARDTDGVRDRIAQCRDREGGNRFGVPLAHRVVACIGTV